MNHLDSELEEDEGELGMEEFRFHELLQRPVIQPFIFAKLISEYDRMLKVLHPFLVILVMMGLLQFSGQGAITFYTAQIFKVRMWMLIGPINNRIR